MRYTACIFASILTFSATAQVDWTSLTPTASPSARSKTRIAFDVVNGKLLMFGGRDQGAVTLDETWSFDGATWTQLSPVNSPPGRWQHTMVTDFLRARIVVFSGWSGGAYYPDTWEWDGSNWTQATPVNSPPERDHHAMAYDLARGKTVMFGGWNYFLGRTLYNDTWEWDGTNWKQITTPNSPSIRDGHEMCFDHARGNIVMFGGGRESATRLGDTWVYDGLDWKQMTPTTSPAPRVSHRMVYDQKREVVVLFGGYDGPSGGGGVYYDDVWEWNGTDWRQRQPANKPSARTYMGMAYDWTASRVLGFGGEAGGPYTGDTWGYAPTHVANHAPFGSGCAGTVGVPSITSNDPWLGENYELNLSGLPNGQLAFFILGVSNTVAALGPLPFPLSGFGFSGCSLLVDPNLAVSVMTASGAASLSIPVPNLAALLGGSIYSQGMVVDPGANPGGAVVSNGVEGVFGGK